MEKVIRVSIYCILALHFALILFRVIPTPVGVWGLLMQVLYLFYLREFSKPNFQSPIFIATSGNIELEIMSKQVFHDLY